MDGEFRATRESTWKSCGVPRTVNSFRVKCRSQKSRTRNESSARTTLASKTSLDFGFPRREACGTSSYLANRRPQRETVFGDESSMSHSPRNHVLGAWLSRNPINGRARRVHVAHRKCVHSPIGPRRSKTCAQVSCAQKGCARGVHAECTRRARDVHAMCTNCARAVHAPCTRRARVVHRIHFITGGG